jgi:hypothetical protein
MIGVSSRLLILAGGCLAGYWLASNPVGRDNADVAFHQESGHSEVQPAEEHPYSPSAISSTCEPVKAAADASLREEQPPEPTLFVLPETGLPPKYREMLTPRGREQETLAELYAAFLKEVRDDAWATPIETRINELIANSGVQGIHAEYVACRVSRCTVAGYADPTVGFDGCSVIMWIGKERILDSDYSSTCSGAEVGGLQRFIVLIDSERAP